MKTTTFKPNLYFCERIPLIINSFYFPRFKATLMLFEVCSLFEIRVCASHTWAFNFFLTGVTNHPPTSTITSPILPMSSFKPVPNYTIFVIIFVIRRSRTPINVSPGRSITLNPRSFLSRIRASQVKIAPKRVNKVIFFL